MNAVPDRDLALYRRLWRYVRPYYGAWAIALVGFLLFASGQPMLAVALKYFVDGLTDPQLARVTLPWGESVNLLPWIPLILVAVALWQGIGTFLGQYGMAKVAAGVVHDLRRDLFAHLLTLPIAYFRDHDSGRTISRLTHDVTMTTTAVTDAVRVLVREGLTVLALLLYLLWSNWRLTLALLIVLPLIALVVRHTQKRLRQAARALQEAVGELTGLATETVRAISDLRAFGAETRIQERFAAANNAEEARQQRLARIAARQTAFTQLLTFTAMGVVLWLVLQLRGDATVGELVAYVSAAGLLPKPLRQLSEVGSRFARGLAGAESAFQLLDTPPEPETGHYAPPHSAPPPAAASTVSPPPTFAADPRAPSAAADALAPAPVLDRHTPNASTPPVAAATLLDATPRRGAHVAFDHVSYRYPNAATLALETITFELRPNQFTALIGRSGSGKSTLVQLLLRFADPTSGTITFNGVPLPEWQRAALRRQIAYVPQAPVLLAGTIAENVALGVGNEPVTRDAIIAALKAAHAWEFVAPLPHGIDTPIGENGAQLSGGQCQRIALARAFLKRAPLLILDEATSALDSETEAAVHEALEQLRHHTTLLVIAHRLSTIERADTIVVLEAGRVVETGTHATLSQNRSRYAQLLAATAPNATRTAST
ncbi:ABC transporter ATP-binding protein [Hydrogenophilus thiooxidans]|uniref:ABC transporter ATP-binding protein n=1 Tax=Hydrogenophilus thiooxidans TaxID=2820326 RepID=UPI001C2290F0|nr:ABC transporter transmembrane domain-containing protein [Hydrogenophilus thiooxidans]